MNGQCYHEQCYPACTTIHTCAQHDIMYTPQETAPHNAYSQTPQHSWLIQCLVTALLLVHKPQFNTAKKGTHNPGHARVSIEHRHATKQAATTTSACLQLQSPVWRPTGMLLEFQQSTTPINPYSRCGSDRLGDHARVHSTGQAVLPMLLLNQLHICW